MILMFYFLFVLFITQIRISAQETPVSNLQREQSKSDLKIVCHYHLHTWYAPDFRDYSADVIDENQCTHIVYTDRVSIKNISIDPSLFHDGKKTFYDRIPVFRRKGVHVSISFFKFNLFEHTRLFNAEERAHFVKSLVEYMEHYNFDGFDAFWGCKSCLKGRSLDVYTDETTNDWMRQLSEAFKPRGWLLSTIIATNKTLIDGGFDIQKLSEYVDWMTATTIPISDKNTALSAPLYSFEGDIDEQFNANWTINYLIEKGVPPRKIVLPLILAGPSYRLESANENGLYARTSQRTSEQFYEICDKVKKTHWSVIHDTNRVGSYAHLDEQWTSYDDVEDVYRKAEYILKMKLGGGVIFNLNGDDFQEKCGCGKNPLLTAINQVLRNLNGPEPKNCT